MNIYTRMRLIESWKIQIITMAIFLASLPIWSFPVIEQESFCLDNAYNPNVPEKNLNDLVFMRGWFTENQGQIENPNVKYVFIGSNISIGFIESGYLIKLTNENNLTSIVKVAFEGANWVVPEGRRELSHRSNYFIGNDSAKWRRGVKNFEKVIYEDLYDGIDLVFYTNEKGLKYDFIVKPGADPEEIRYSYNDVDCIHVDPEENLHLVLPSGELIEEAPCSYQIKDGKKIEVLSYYHIIGNNIGFDIGVSDPTLPLVIDPLIYSTYIGGSLRDVGYGIALDNENNAYVTGWTDSSDFPTTPGCYDDFYNGQGLIPDVFVCKFNSDCSELIYSTFLGGSSGDATSGIVIDTEGNAYITGITYSPDYPTTLGSYDPIFRGTADGFITKLNRDGSDLVYSTFIGGSAFDRGWKITLDNENNAYITGKTNSTEFPTTFGSYDNIPNGGDDCYVLKLNPDGSDLIYSTLIGGRGTDIGHAIAVDEENNAIIGGWFTNSEDFPTTPGCYDDTLDGGRDMFVTKMNSDGSDLIFSTFLGGNDDDHLYGLVIDKEANVYVTGGTYSADFPTTPGCYDDTYNECDGVICRLKKDGTELEYSTFNGGSRWEHQWAIDIDNSNNVYVTGYTGSSDFPTTPGCFDDTLNGSYDVYIFALNIETSTLLYSTYIGGSYNEDCHDLTVDSNDNVIITGATNSIDFPTTSGCYDPTINGDRDVFVLCMKLEAEFDEGEIENDDDDDSNNPHYDIIVIGIVGTGLISIAGLAYLREDLRFSLYSIITIPLYSKLEKDEILEQPKRQNIYNHIVENPGIHFSRIHKDLKIGQGTLVHHLKILEKEQFIRSKRYMGMKLFYPRDLGWDYDDDESKIHLLSPIQQKVMNYLEEHGTASRQEIQVELEMKSSTLTYCLRRLRDGGWIFRNRCGKNVMYSVVEEK